MGHGCVRANLPAGRVHPGDQTGPCGLTGVCAARRARGRRHLHLNFIFNPDDPHEFAEIKDLNSRLVRRALVLEAHATGEHGIGLGKIDYLTEEHGEAVEVMKAIKRALDPDNRMNPGKVVRLT